LFQIFCQPNIKTRWHLIALQNIDIGKIHKVDRLAEPKPFVAMRLDARLRCAPARQPSPSAALRAKAGGGGGS
jgi:hypothetical protein